MVLLKTHVWYPLQNILYLLQEKIFNSIYFRNSPVVVNIINMSKPILHKIEPQEDNYNNTNM